MGTIGRASGMVLERGRPRNARTMPAGAPLGANDQPLDHPHPVALPQISAAPVAHGG